jgi:ABC-type oligopeptide transport system ATPase subunit
LGEHLLEVQDLKLYFKVKAGYVHAVNGVSFSVKPGERVGVVGESG